MLPLLRNRTSDLIKLRESIVNSDKLENIRRSQILRELIRKPKYNLNDKECRYLGDAVFSLLAPDDSEILTTNKNDHCVLAKSINKTAITPEEAISKYSEVQKSDNSL